MLRCYSKAHSSQSSTVIIAVSASIGCVASNRDTDACCKSSLVTDYYGEKTGRGLIRIAQECATYEQAFASTSRDPVPLMNMGDLRYSLPDTQNQKNRKFPRPG